MKNLGLVFLILGMMAGTVSCDRIPFPLPSVPQTNPFGRTMTPTLTATPTVTMTKTTSPTPYPTNILTPTPGTGSCGFTPLAQWGAPGVGNVQFRGVTDLDVDGSGNLYVLDSGNWRVQKLDSTGAYVTQWNANNSFLIPTNLAYSPLAGRVYVVDTAPTPTAGAMKIFDGTGIALPGWTLPLNSKGLAVDSQGNIYLGEQSLVVRFDRYGFNPVYYYNQGVAGSQFYGVRALAADPAGNLFVADNSLIQKFNPAQGYLTRWGAPGTGTGQFSGIAFMKTDASGNLFVVDNPVAGTAFNGRVQKFDNNGNFICYYQIAGVMLKGLAFDAAGKIYLVDATNQRILKFTP